MTGWQHNQSPTRSNSDLIQVPEEQTTSFAEEGQPTMPAQELLQVSETQSSGLGTIAYEILLLQQRLNAYEQLHMEEMAELRREVERLSRTFLHATDPNLLHHAAEKHSSHTE